MTSASPLQSPARLELDYYFTPRQKARCKKRGSFLKCSTADLCRQAKPNSLGQALPPQRQIDLAPEARLKRDRRRCTGGVTGAQSLADFAAGALRGELMAKRPEAIGLEVVGPVARCFMPGRRLRETGASRSNAQRARLQWAGPMLRCRYRNPASGATARIGQGEQLELGHPAGGSAAGRPPTWTVASMGCLRCPDGLADQAVVSGIRLFSGHPGLGHRRPWIADRTRCVCVLCLQQLFCLRLSRRIALAAWRRGSVPKADAAQQAFEASRPRPTECSFIAVQSDLIRSVSNGFLAAA